MYIKYVENNTIKKAKLDGNPLVQGKRVFMDKTTFNFHSL